jgi:hypothetical protein
VNRMLRVKIALTLLVTIALAIANGHWPIGP